MDQHILHPPLNEKEAAKVLGLAKRTLQNWRFRRMGPAYLKIGGRVAYLAEDLDEYRKKRRIAHEIS